MSIAFDPFQMFRSRRDHGYSPLTEPAREHVQVGQFVILSMLLHVLLIILFGDSTGGSPSRAAQLIGGFNASIQARVNNNTAGLPSLNSPAARSDTAQPAAIEPLRPSTLSAPAAPDVPPATPSTPATEPDKLAVPDALPALPTLSKSVVQPTTAFVVDAPKAAIETVPALDASALAPLPKAPPLIVPKPMELNAAPSVTREFAPYVPPALAIATPTLPTALPAALPKLAPAATVAPLSLPPVTPLALPAIAAPKIAREFVAPANIEVREPLIVPPPIATIAPAAVPKTEREFVPYVAPIIAPAPAPATETPPLRVPAATSAPAVTTSTPTSPAAPAPPVPSIERSAAPAATATAPAATSTAPAPTTAIKTDRAAPGAPAPAAAKSVDDIFGARRGDAALPAKSIDLDSARKSARESSSQATSESRNDRAGPRTLFPFPTVAKPPVKSDVTKIFDKALKRTDCKDAYADMGLAAVIPLVRDAIKQDGCKW